MENDKFDRDLMKSAINSYEIAVKNRTLSEYQVNILFQKIEEILPNSRFSDIYFLFFNSCPLV